jgi:acetylornithine deacetylase/succinyl-diaminopimelate desuccinylase-like protein
MIKDPIEALSEYVRCPSVSADSAYADGLDAARTFAAGQLTALGFEVEIVETPKHPIIFAERGGDPSWPCVLIYGHYDVQPADPFDLWDSPAFEPRVRNGRIFARGAADNKGPQIVHMTALGRVLEKQPDLPLRIKYLIEGEEEIGSPSFKGFLSDYKDRLKADMVLVSDTGSPSPEQLVITTGLRGLAGFEVKVKGPKSDLHSGVHGGAVMNPLQALMQICSSLHNSDGRVNVPGFYDDVLPVYQWEQDELYRLPTTLDEYQDFLGVPQFHSAKGYTPFEAIRFGPTLEFNGVGGGYQGEGKKTVIPSEAFAKISCRLVPNQRGKEIAELVMQTIRDRCPASVIVEITDPEMGDPYLVVPPGHENTSGDISPFFARAFERAELAIEGAFGTRPIYLREGGSIPIISDLKDVVGLDSLLIGLFTPEDNLHAPNESFHLGILDKAIGAFEVLFKDLAGL